MPLSELYLTGWEQIGSPFFDLVDGNVESGGNDAALVQTSGEIDDDFAWNENGDDFNEKRN